MRVAPFVAALLLPYVHVQAQASASSQRPQSAAIQRTQEDSGAFTFHITTREVVVDLTALKERGGPVLGLTGGDLQVYYSAGTKTNPEAPPRADSSATNRAHY